LTSLTGLDVRATYFPGFVKMNVNKLSLVKRNSLLVKLTRFMILKL
jgi:hypothetical protein